MKYPFLISIPHGGIEIPTEVAGRFALSEKEIFWYCDPSTRVLFDFGRSAEVSIDTNISRMVIDLNRPPLPLPPKDPDGIIKVRTVDGRPVYRPGQMPDLPLIHQLMMKWYFPYHQRIDELIDQYPVSIAFDCHSMLPYGSTEQNDAGKRRPLICLGNYGDDNGRPKQGSLTTCPPDWIVFLAESFREEFSGTGEVAINTPFSGGFISNAHYWRKGIPWIQIEVNRALYEPRGTPAHQRDMMEGQIPALRRKIWQILTRFWDGISEMPMEESLQDLRK
ncbi:N-formylglutamate amidohydrolase [Methanoregula sp.]|uniref:N-formylglutamate amidohydrolase n=1 Tax=Methanoregula sp. TaxID=2052170 RepID=UPI003BB1B2D2